MVTKIHIIGIAGSGKTTLAERVSDHCGIPAFDLDPIVYDAEGERPAIEIARRIDEIRALDGWVTEGAYRDEWLRPLLDDADAIAWLDPPFAAAMWRIVKRHVVAELRRNNRHPGWRKLRRFLDYNRRTFRQQSRETRELIAAYGDKCVRVRRSSDANSFLVNLPSLSVER